MSSYVVDAWSGLQIIATGLGAYFEGLGLRAIALWDILSDPGNAPQTFRNLQQSLADLESRSQQAIDAEMAANGRRQEVVGQVKGAFEGLRDKVPNAVAVTHEASAAAEQHAASESRRALSLKQAKDAAKEAAEGLKTYADVTRAAQGDERMPVVRLRNGSHHGWSVVSGPQQRWELGVAAALPLELKIHGVASRVRADLERGRLSAAKLEGAFNDYELRLPALPAPSASAAEALSASAAKPAVESVVEIRLNGAFSNLSILVPRGTLAHVRADGPFNIVEGGSERGDGPRYGIRIQGAFNHLSIEEGLARPSADPRSKVGTTTRT